MDTNRLRHLLDKRDAIDREIQDAVISETVKKVITCSHCGLEGHTARTCPQRMSRTLSMQPTEPTQG